MLGKENLAALSMSRSIGAKSGNSTCETSRNEHSDKSASLTITSIADGFGEYRDYHQMAQRAYLLIHGLFEGGEGQGTIVPSVVCLRNEDSALGSRILDSIKGQPSNPTSQSTSSTTSSPLPTDTGSGIEVLRAAELKLSLLSVIRMLIA
ncbi:hypothetical protein CC78DRAFT_587147 [Lojkania enalia]|uniref:Uncharacterized protein n=1 Tax=Lojkania enalia TaxID=147567 RepID=A0A9P4JXW9_9PLEO|nr:hypothetical protein CC78DRAFT_587147 [Didymosphaeria enalia]